MTPKLQNAFLLQWFQRFRDAPPQYGRLSFDRLVPLFQAVGYVYIQRLLHVLLTSISPLHFTTCAILDESTSYSK